MLGLLGMLNASRINQAILVVLGLLAYTILRDRHRAEQADRESQTVRLVDSVEIRRELEEARRRTSVWMYKGGTGTYLRAVTLPHCVRNAHRERRHVRIQVEIIDPTNEVLCDYYANLRHFRPDDTGEAWTFARTRNESYATILAACWYLQRYAILRIDVALSATASTFRWDLSSSCAFMTQEDPSPNLLVREPSPLYDFCTRELHSSFGQARRVPLELAKAVRLSDEPSAREARCLFSELGMELPVTMVEDDITEIIQKALHARSPYP